MDLTKKNSDQHHVDSSFSLNGIRQQQSLNNFYYDLPTPSCDSSSGCNSRRTNEIQPYITERRIVSKRKSRHIIIKSVNIGSNLTLSIKNTVQTENNPNTSIQVSTDHPHKIDVNNNKKIDNVQKYDRVKQRNKRTSFNTEQLIGLEGAFSRTRYIGRSDRWRLSHELKLTENQIKIWLVSILFNNVDSM